MDIFKEEFGGLARYLVIFLVSYALAFAIGKAFLTAKLEESIEDAKRSLRAADLSTYVTEITSATRSSVIRFVWIFGSTVGFVLSIVAWALFSKG